jgi:hypothetical protein
VGEDDERHADRLTALNTNGCLQQHAADTPNFNGEHVNQSFQLAWTAVPAANWNTRAYYYWTKLDNKSTLVEFGNAPVQPLASGLGCGDFLVAGFRRRQRQLRDRALQLHEEQRRLRRVVEVRAGQRLGFGYDYLNIDQTRVDYDSSHTNKLWVEYKNTMFDTWSGRLEVPVPEARHGSQLHQQPASGRRREQPEFLLAFTSAFDMQSSTTNLVKLISTGTR